MYIATAYRIGKRWKEIHDEGGITDELVNEYGTIEDFLDAWTDDKALELNWRSGDYGARLYRQGDDTLPDGQHLVELEFSI